MQALVPTGDRNPNAHTEDEILDALRARSGARRLSFRYELLDSTNIKLRDLDNVLGGSVANNSLADIKRTAKFAIRDGALIDYLSNRIKPWVRLHLEPYGADDWVEWPQGVFLLSTPSRTVDQVGVVVRDVAGYDALQVFADDLIDTRYTLAAGASYTSAVSTLLGSISKNVAASAAVAVTAREWEPGTSKLKIINEMLTAINYESLSFDEDGVAQVQPYRAPSTRAVEYTYADDADSVIVPQVEQTLDLFVIPNKWVLVVSDPDRAALTGTYTNNDPSSPTSTIRRGRTIVDFRTEQDAPDQASLDAKAARLAFEASQVYEAIDFDTAIMPFHSTIDVYQLVYSRLAIDAKYSEHAWSFPLQAGGRMQHRARRVVSV